MEKILYFEGAGWKKAESNGVGNCRIRTRFYNNKKENIYLELGKCGGVNEGLLQVDFCFLNHCNELGYYRNQEGFKKNIQYSKKEILNWINEKLFCDFTDIIVINDNSFRVHADGERERKFDSNLKQHNGEVFWYYENNFNNMEEVIKCKI